MSTATARAHLSRALLVTAAALSVAGCAAERHLLPAQATTAAYIVQVSTADGSVQASYHEGQPPARPAGSTVTADLPGVIIVGGSSPVSIRRAEAFQQVLFNIGGYDGWYQLDLPAPVTSVDAVVSWSQDIPRLEFQARTGAAEGEWAMTTVRAMRVGTGDVQVSVAFDSTSDVDLHVIDPSGEEIYYGSRESASGGKLDLDANAGCSVPPRPVNAENITWAGGTAPRGQYTVYLDYFSDCGHQATSWVVTVHRRGQPLQVFTGRFTGPASQSNTMVPITTFTY